MPTTRSMKKALSIAVNAIVPTSVRAKPSKPVKSKRKNPSESEDDLDSQPVPLVSKLPKVSSASNSAKKPRIDIPEPPVISQQSNTTGVHEVLPPVLSFSFEAAKEHLINADSRFRDIFNKLPCRPFQHMERVEPFRTLTTSILGQQISWLAARSITHRFIRLYYPHLPEKLPPAGSSEAKVPHDVFPTAQQVAESEVHVLKSAGLSTRKAEYVKDLASRFADGRLSTQKLLEADDDELARLLIEVRGIGRIIHAVDMFAIFSLRRPDILPVGDLGVQRGMLRWFLALHSADDPVHISPKKLPKDPGNVNDDEVKEDEKNTAKYPDSENLTSVSNAALQLPGPPPPTSLASGEDDVSSLPPVPPATPAKRKIAFTEMPGTPLASAVGEQEESVQGTTTPGGLPAFPGPFTPSVNKILKRVREDSGERTTVPSLPEGLSVATLKSRSSGKKVKGAFLTPQEMEALAESWRPYRSLGVYYMWALAEEPTAKK